MFCLCVINAHAPLPTGRTLDGQNIADLLTGKASSKTYQHRAIYIVNHGKLEAVRLGEWKYREAAAPSSDPVSGNAGPVLKELFNISWDPSERTNVLEEYSEKAREMKVLFDAFTGREEINNHVATRSIGYRQGL